MLSPASRVVLMAVSRTLTQARLVKRMTQSQVAVAAHLGKNTIHLIEAGEDTHIGTLTKCAEAVGCSLEIKFIPNP